MKPFKGEKVGWPFPALCFEVEGDMYKDVCWSQKWNRFKTACVLMEAQISHSKSEFILF